MAMKNAKSIRSAIAVFFKENGRYPEFKEFVKLVTGKSEGKKREDKKEEPKLENQQGA